MHRRHDNRSLHFAVLASLALHAVLLMASPSLRNSAKTALNPAPIMARLVQPALDTVSAPAEPLQPSVQRRLRSAKPTPAPVPSAPEETGALPETEAPEPFSSAAAVPASPLPSSEPNLAQSAEAEADSLAKFRLEIIAAARRLKRYPPLALDNNWHGTAQVRVSFAAQGGRASVSVARSSGHEVLDQQAIDLITRALLPLPALLRGREFALEIPVIYHLEEAARG